MFLLRKKIPASHRARGGTPIVSISLGANAEGKERVKGKASRIHSSRKGSALVCVRNVQRRELKTPIVYAICVHYCRHGYCAHPWAHRLPSKASSPVCV